MQQWFTVTEIDAQSYAISEWGHWEKVHSFLLVGKDEALLIDTGMGIGSILDVVRSITALPITVCTTHIHTDHIGGHAEFTKHFVHEAELEWLEKGIPGRPIEAVKKDLVRDCTQPFPSTFSLENYQLYTGQAARVLKDGDEIEFGGRVVEVLHTPGHSPGHLCFFEHVTGYLFTGDLFYLETPIYAFYPSTNPSDLMNSLQKIIALEGVTKIFGSHNQLGIDPIILKEVEKAVYYINEHQLAKFGTGVHQFKQFAFQF